MFPDLFFISQPGLKLFPSSLKIYRGNSPWGSLRYEHLNNGSVVINYRELDKENTFLSALPFVQLTCYTLLTSGKTVLRTHNRK